MNAKNPTIVTIQTILRGIGNEEFNNSKAIKLVRHADNRKNKDIDGVLFKGSILNLYRYERERFVRYQSEQLEGRFDGVDYLVVFVGEKGTKARFIAIYKILSSSPHPHKKGECVLELQEVEDFKHLSERIVIDWGGGVAKYYHDFKIEKPVIRIDEGFEDENGVPRFISYPDTVLSYEELKSVFTLEPEAWKSALQAVNGIYMILDKKDGKMYVGSTYNREGIWGRWAAYFKTDGHGGNVELEEKIADNPSYAKNFQWSILETLPINITLPEAVERENLYKLKFLTRNREFGYNKN